MAIAELRRQFEDMASRFMASDQGQRVIAWYEQLGDRDRIALRTLSGFLALVVVFVLVLKPLMNFGDAAQRRLQEERELLGWLKAHEAAVGHTSGATPRRDQPVASLVNSTAQQHQLTLRRYEPVDENTVRLWLDGANFNNVVKWLHTLGNEHGIQAVEMNVERESEPGRVSVRLTLAG